MSTNQISRSYHEGIPSYEVKKSQYLLGQILSLGQNFLATVFLFIDILLKLQYWYAFASLVAIL